MNTFDLFVEAFKARVVLKSNQGKAARVAEFDAVVSEVTGEHGVIPDIARIRAYFVKCLSDKPNWGCRKVIETFDYTVTQIRTAG
jgi:hypothetical protein